MHSFFNRTVVFILLSNDLECDDGYYGQDCILPCKYPSYGGKCQQTCNCMPFICNNINGCENITGIVSNRKQMTKKFDYLKQFLYSQLITFVVKILYCYKQLCIYVNIIN